MLQFYLDQEVSNAIQLHGLQKRIYILVRVVNAFTYMQQLLIFEVRQMFNGKKHIFTYTFVIRMLCLIKP